MDPAEELAALIADTLAAAESWRATGAFLAPTGPLAGLPPAEPWPAGLPTSQRRIEPPRANVRPVDPPAARPMGTPRPSVAPPASVGPPAAARPVASHPVEPRPPVEARPVSTPRAEPARAEAPALGGGGLAGLFGAKWAQATRDPVDEVAALVAAAARCGACNTEPASLKGTGASAARLAVVAVGPRGQRLTGDAGVMFDKMLMHVLALERADVWLFEANACAVEGRGTCRELLVRQIEVVAPRLVLAMGGGAAVLGVRAGRGEWARWREADVLPTFHPEELLARPGDKRAAMEHLTAVRQRL